MADVPYFLVKLCGHLIGAGMKRTPIPHDKSPELLMIHLKRQRETAMGQGRMKKATGRSGGGHAFTSGWGGRQGLDVMACLVSLSWLRIGPDSDF